MLYHDFSTFLRSRVHEIAFPKRVDRYRSFFHILHYEKTVPLDKPVILKATSGLRPRMTSEVTEVNNLEVTE